MLHTLPVLLTVLFVALKLTDTIAWSWLWVLSPLWITVASALCLGLFALLGMLALIKRG